MYDAAARDIFCVLSKDGRSTLMNPGLNRPWTSKNRKQADLVAKENGGIVVDMDTAIRKNFAALTARN